MKKFLTVFTFAAIITAFNILILGAWLEKDQAWVNTFVIFFVVGALSFWGWLALENKENKITYKKKGKTYIK
jgi:hypothetical protein